MLVLSCFLQVAFAAVVVSWLTTTRIVAAISDSFNAGEPWAGVWSISVGAGFAIVTWDVATAAIVTWGVATAAFAVNVFTVASYNRVYGWLSEALALLVWLYIGNV